MAAITRRTRRVGTARNWRSCSLRSHAANNVDDYNPQLKILSWNIASLRSMLKRAAGAELSAVIQSQKPDIVFLQEHKLQHIHVAEFEPQLLQIFNRNCPGQYRAAWAVSTSRKGYSGVCAIYRDSAGGGIREIFTGEIDQVDADEGRSVRLDLACGLIVIGMYVPNSGQKLARLPYRVNVWDKMLLSYLQQLNKKAGSKGGLVICGDLNVAHQDIDIWNSGAAHLQRQAGTTAKERSSFANLLNELDLVDAFRHYNPEATEVYTYWSSRCNNRPVNKGLRLDYFLCSRRLFNKKSED